MNRRCSVMASCPLGEVVLPASRNGAVCPFLPSRKKKGRRHTGEGFLRVFQSTRARIGISSSAEENRKVQQAVSLLLAFCRERHHSRPEVPLRHPAAHR